MPIDYQGALSRTLNDTNDLLELQIELLLASLSTHETYDEFDAKLQRIKERRNRAVPIRPTAHLIQMGRVE